ncbi:NADP-dependent oxidoreductase [Methylobacterium persicinum]|uniref:NADPH-dependent curcumin reductase CurA n=1 Tax=Methylobacterium persicinum TaxID=374426 RepID=A0ABU0HN92_9HYPH|nr:NADP-dependent oxidoreductase [Methylobacterium persicinum]MDQ0443792.1 NADPH-dependent curcumin reductase CurA [Methylobacterium persicinum]GJE37483.1 NADPH-dependent curcumin reductase [Methylobacterium persicinum]
MAAMNRRIVLAARPHGEPTPQDFRLEEVPIPTPGPGEVLLRTKWLSLDPYMRGRMSAAKSYAAPVEIGDPITAETVGEVVASNNPDYRVGDLLTAFAGWQEYFVTDGKGGRRVDPSEAPPSTALGILGMPGMTAYTGLLNIGQPKPGETVAVAAATGPVGSMVGQIARLKGARAVGIAGGPDKCRYLTEELGFDAAVDHRAPDFPEALAQACPKGIDVYFENVGGAVFDAVLPLLNDFARLPVCGLVSSYNATEVPPGPDQRPALLRMVLTKRLHIQGFIVWDFRAQAGDFHRDVSDWLKEGRLRYREDVVEGLEKAPEAFIGMLKGRNFGKLVVRVSP